MKTALAQGLLSLLVGIVSGSVAGGPEAVRTGATALEAVSKLISQLVKDTAKDRLKSE